MQSLKQNYNLRNQFNSLNLYNSTFSAFSTISNLPLYNKQINKNLHSINYCRNINKNNQ